MSNDRVSRELVRCLYNEVNCRIEHGAESGGHLEYVQDRLASILASTDSATPHDDIPVDDSPFMRVLNSIIGKRKDVSADDEYVSVCGPNGVPYVMRKKAFDEMFDRGPITP